MEQKWLFFIQKNIIYFRTEQNGQGKWAGGGEGREGGGSEGILFTNLPLYYFMITKLRLFL